MRGFPGKIRHLAWSQALTKTGAPLLASASAECIVVWEKHPDVSRAWEGRVLERHTEVVQAITFQSNTLLLASASEDGWVCLWHKATRLAQHLKGSPDSFILPCMASPRTSTRRRGEQRRNTNLVAKPTWSRIWSPLSET